MSAGGLGLFTVDCPAHSRQSMSGCQQGSEASCRFRCASYPRPSGVASRRRERWIVMASIVLSAPAVQTSWKFENGTTSAMAPRPRALRLVLSLVQVPKVRSVTCNPPRETSRHGDWPFQSVSCPGRPKTRAPRREDKDLPPHCQPRSAVGPLIAPRQKLPRVGGVVGQPVPAEPACQVSLAAPSRLERESTLEPLQMHPGGSAGLTGLTGLRLRPSACCHPFPAPTITSRNRRHHPAPRCWQRVAPAPCLGWNPGVVWPGWDPGTTRMQSHTFWDGRWERVLRSLSATCPERGGPRQPRQNPSPLPGSCSIQTRNAQQKN